MLDLRPPVAVPKREAEHLARPESPWTRCSATHVAFARTREAHLREELVAAHLGLAHKLARRFVGRGEPLDDLVQVASLGLLQAIDRFDPHRGSFASFAVPTVEGVLKRYLRDCSWTVRPRRALHDQVLRISSAEQDLLQELGRRPSDQEVADRAGATLAEVREAHQAPELRHPTSLDAPVQDGMTAAERLVGEDTAPELSDQRLDVARLLSQLSSDERELVRLRFFEGLTQKEIAARLGVSQMQVSRLLTRTLARLQALARDRAIGCW